MEDKKNMNYEDNRKKVIAEGKAILGIELGSTRIKAVLIEERRLRPAAMTGKTGMRMVSGLTVWKTSGVDCRPVTRIWHTM